MRDREQKCVPGNKSACPGEKVRASVHRDGHNNRPAETKKCFRSAFLFLKSLIYNHIRSLLVGGISSREARQEMSLSGISLKHTIISAFIKTRAIFQLVIMSGSRKLIYRSYVYYVWYNFYRIGQTN